MTQWKRVNRRNPCSVCGKPDWCTYTYDTACCMRVESGRPMRNGGWAHPRTPVSIDDSCSAPQSTPAAIDVPSMMREYRLCMTRRIMRTCTNTLGLTEQSLANLGIGWCIEAQAMAFPMYDRVGPVGIRLRSMNGRKWSVPGSRSGIFRPANQAASATLLICEGPTDTAAAMDLDYYALGRPSCSGAVDITISIVKAMPVERIIIVSDGDEPGLRGACHLANRMWNSGIRVNIIIPPAKDLREWVNQGATRDDVEELIEAADWSLK